MDNNANLTTPTTPPAAMPSPAPMAAQPTSAAQTTPVVNQPQIMQSQGSGGGGMKWIIIVIVLVLVIILGAGVYLFMNGMLPFQIPGLTPPSTSTTQPITTNSTVNTDDLADELNSLDSGDIDSDFTQVDSDLQNL